MVVRSRSRTKTSHIGSHKRTGRDTFITQQFTVESIIDNVLPGNGHPLTIDRFTYQGEKKFPIPEFTGSYSWSGRAITLDRFPVRDLASPNSSSSSFNSSHIPVGGSPTLASAAAKIAADTNPSRPLLDLPVFIFELRELPNLLLQRSKNIGVDIARGRLSLEYGWKPLINDLLGLLEFKRAFNDRVIEINALRRSGLRRKRIVFNGSSTPESFDHASALMNEQGLIVLGHSDKVTTEKVTGFVKWMPDEDIPRHLGLWNETAEQKALFALLGLNPTIADASTLWEILPFSWLADWCSNMGDYLAAHRNIVGAHIEEILIMRHYLTEHKISIKAGGSLDEQLNFTRNLRTQPWALRYHETKTREPTSLGVSAHMPFLNERKVMILADIVRGQSGKFRRR